MQKHKIKLNEIEMQMILETVKKTAYLGEHSEIISNVKRKMTIKQAPPDDEEKTNVADLVKRLPPREK